MQLQFVTLDVFTSTPLLGNPVAIVKVPSSATNNITQETKQLIAREFNLSETVMLHEQSQEDIKNEVVRIDIFTQYAEIPFAGHPTVGTTNYLLRNLKHNFKILHTKAGAIPVALEEGGEAIKLEVAHNVRIHDQPFKGQPFGHFPVVSIVKGMNFILAKMKDLEELGRQKKSLLEDYQDTSALDEGWQVGLMVSYFYVDLGPSKDGVRQIRTRSMGSLEDPATGSAASALCSYLSLSTDGARTRRYQITQGIEMGRKSDISVEVTTVEGGHAIEKVVLRGTAIKIMEGTIEVP